MISAPFAILVGATVTFLLLLAAHILAWPYRNKMHRTVAYCIGVSCIGVGILTAAALMDDWIIFITFVGVGLPGGLLILAAWWWRGARGETPADSIIRRAQEGARAMLGKPGHLDN